MSKIIKILFCMVLVPLWACSLFAEEQKPWQQLNLGSITVADATVYYEKSFEEKLPLFRKIYEDYRNRINIRKEMLTNEKLKEDIRNIVGQTDFDIDKQLKSVARITGSLALRNTTFYLMIKSTVKGYLRKGGNLPNISYDRQTDMVQQSFGFIAQIKDSEVVFTSQSSGGRQLEITIPVDGVKSFENDVEKFFGYLEKCIDPGIVLHEIIEMSILRRLKPEDPYWRWFSDGFANVITIEFLKKYAGLEFADEFAGPYYIAEYKSLEKEINLRYWMGLNFCIKTPLEYENKLQLARYAYATQEALRLIEKHGIDSVRSMLDTSCNSKSRKGDDILQAIKQVTGEDMQQRFDHYQTFQTRRDGIAKYGKLFNAAREKEDYEQMLIALLRVLELQDNQLSPTGLECYKDIALLLFNMGYEYAGDRAMHGCVELFKNSGIPMARDAALETFIIYALECKNPQKAGDIADELLNSKPDHVLALTIQMVEHAEAGRLSEAKQIAEKVMNLDKNEQSPARRTAAQILAAGPNQQEPNK